MRALLLSLVVMTSGCADDASFYVLAGEVVLTGDTTTIEGVPVFLLFYERAGADDPGCVGVWTECTNARTAGVDIAGNCIGRYRGAGVEVLVDGQHDPLCADGEGDIGHRAVFRDILDDHVDIDRGSGQRPENCRRDARSVGHAPERDAVISALVRSFGRVFGRTMEPLAS